MNIHWQIGYEDAMRGRKYHQDQFRDEFGAKWFAQLAVKARSDYMAGYDAFGIEQAKLHNFVILLGPSGLVGCNHNLRSLPGLTYE